MDVKQIKQHVGAGMALTEDGRLIRVRETGSRTVLTDARGRGFAPPSQANWHYTPKRRKGFTPSPKEPIYISHVGAYLRWEFDGELDLYGIAVNAAGQCVASCSYVWGDLQILDGRTQVYYNSSGEAVAPLAETVKNGPYFKLGDSFLTPYGVAVAIGFPGELNFLGLYVLDTGNHRVGKWRVGTLFLRYAVVGSEGSGADQFQSPRGIAGYGDLIFIADTGNHRIMIREATDLSACARPLYVAQFGSQGSGNDQFQSPCGIAADSNQVYMYIADTGNHRIMRRYAIFGMEYIEQAGSQGSELDQLNAPEALAVNDQYLYVADTGNHRIVVYERFGLTPVTAIGSQGSGADQFNFPAGLCCDGDYLYVADTGNNRLMQRRLSDLSLIRTDTLSERGPLDAPHGLVSAEHIWLPDPYRWSYLIVADTNDNLVLNYGLEDWYQHDLWNEKLTCATELEEENIARLYLGVVDNIPIGEESASRPKTLTLRFNNHLSDPRVLPKAHTLIVGYFTHNLHFIDEVDASATPIQTYIANRWPPA